MRNASSAKMWLSWKCCCLFQQAWWEKELVESCQFSKWRISAHCHQAHTLDNPWWKQDWTWLAAFFLKTLCLSLVVRQMTPRFWNARSCVFGCRSCKFHLFSIFGHLSLEREHGILCGGLAWQPLVGLHSDRRCRELLTMIWLQTLVVYPLDMYSCFSGLLLYVIKSITMLVNHVHRCRL